MQFLPARRSLLLGAGCAACLGPAIAQHGATSAEAFPHKPVRIVVTVPPGGGADFLARTLARKLQERWNQPVTVDTRTGAGGLIGIDSVARSPADGHTLILQISSLTSLAALQSRTGTDPIKGLAPITIVCTSPAVLTVSRTSDIRTIQDLVKKARAESGRLNYASSGLGTQSHFMGELFNANAGVELQHVPYRGSAPSIQALLAGEVQLSFPLLSSATSYLSSGQLRALAVTGPRRNPAWPAVPTLTESGVAGFELDIWYGLLTTAGTPRPVIDKLQREVARLARAPDFRAMLLTQGNEPVAGSPEDFAKVLETETRLWAQLLRQRNIRAE